MRHPSATPTVFSNRLAERPAGGVTVILFDRLNSSLEDQKSARDQILKLLANARAGDHVALYVLESDIITVLHDFTSDAGRLIARAQSLSGHDLGRVVAIGRDRAGLCADRRRRRGCGYRSVVGRERRRWCRRCICGGARELTTNALESIANHLAGIPGRKNLVWVSGAFPFVIPSDHGPQIMNKEVNRATRAINTRRCRRLSGRHPRLDRRVRESDGRHGDHPPGRRAAARRSSRRWRRRIRIRTRCAQIADATGGRVYLNTNAIGEAIRKAIDDSRVSYVLGYYSSRPDDDNKFRNITVKVNRSGIELRHRKGYLRVRRSPCAMRERGSTRSTRVMLSPIEASRHQPRRRRSRGRGMRAPSSVRIDPESLTWEQKKDVREAAIDVVIAQSVPDGRYFTIKETTVNLTADPERYQQMIEDGLTLSSNFTAVPMPTDCTSSFLTWHRSRSAR